MLYIVRHGETDWNREHKVQGRTDIPLNDYGRRLARETAEGMKDIPIDLCFTSPLLRAKETAQIILEGRMFPSVMKKGSRRSVSEDTKVFTAEGKIRIRRARRSTVSFMIRETIPRLRTPRRSRSSTGEPEVF